MFGYEILRNKWVIIVLFGGVALILYVLFYYIDLRQPRKRKKDKPDEYETNYLSTWEAIPWSLRVTVAVIMIFMISYTIFRIISPKSW